MRICPWQRGLSLHGSQGSLSLLVVLVSHVLLMVTPWHDVVVEGHGAVPPAMAAHAAHAASAPCVEQAARAEHHGYDCAIRGNTPPRSGPAPLLRAGWTGRVEPVGLAGLLPAPLERSTWPPPLADLQVLFQVFRN